MHDRSTDAMALVLRATGSRSQAARAVTNPELQASGCVVSSHAEQYRIVLGVAHTRCNRNFYHVSKKYMLLFLAEWQLRHNHRKNPDMLEDHIIGRILRLNPSSGTAAARLARTALLECLISVR